MATRADDGLAALLGSGDVPRRADVPGILIGGRAGREKKREYLLLSLTRWPGVILAVVWLIVYGSGWLEWSAFLFFYVLNMMGVTIGYHRYFIHNCFKTSRPMRYALGIMAQLAGQASVRKWVLDHRRHHARTDQPGDPHSPYFDSEGRPASGLKAFYNAHMGWFFDESHTDTAIYGKGLDDEVLRFTHRTRWIWYYVSIFLLPALWALAFAGLDWRAIVGTIFVGGFLRVNAVLHAELSLNSFGHRQGYQLKEGGGESRNNWWLAIVTLGDGWHNNHHHHPRTATNRLRWWEFDFCGAVIRLWEAMGLVWDVQRAPRYVRGADGTVAPQPGA